MDKNRVFKILQNFENPSGGIYGGQVHGVRHRWGFLGF
jgi:hypothetical protein